MNFIEKTTLDYKSSDIFTRDVSTRRIGRNYDTIFSAYTVNDDMYGPIILNNALRGWEIGIVIGFEI